MYIVKTLGDAIEAQQIKKMKDGEQKTKREKLLTQKVLKRTLLALKGKSSNDDVFPGTEEERLSAISEIESALLKI